ncbi:MAG: RluA family pseudouridine synthase [Oscillospiraceae bacterium]|jgi:23S rRNA pseudouridine1911/1915/1917 synthase
MTTRTITVTAQESGERIDALLARLLPDISRSAAQKLLESGAVTKDGRPLKKNYKVTSGESFLVEMPEPENLQVLPQDIPLEIVYEDDDLIVVNKPQGMVVHPAPGHYEGTLVNALMHHCGDSLSGIGGVLRPGIVHRLDKDTSGLIIAAKNDFAHQSLSRQLSSRSLSRVYETIVLGRIRQDSGTVDAPIGRHPTQRKLMAVTDKNSRPAVTHYEVINRYRNHTHLRCRLETGRTHQIRVHMAHMGHPVLGDPVYGRKRNQKGLSGQCLHAKQLKFVHPRTGEQIELSCDLPEYFIKALSQLGPPEN